ncbi:MAG TPA: HAD-IA family hydrolase [Acidimicrobiia bacterium]|nr:HAD-IA family hydrolase [Acidimicrobiia bacterium]
MNPFRNFETLSFDCYGTLIDWETGIRTALTPWAERNQLALDEVTARFGAIESQVQREAPSQLYPYVLSEVLRRMGNTTDEEAGQFGASVGNWPPFSDSVDALKKLKTRYRLAILSNVDRASFARSNALLGVEFDLVVTAEEVGSYKPNPRNFEALFERLKLSDRSPLLHVAQSPFHDHQPALAAGLETVWINRPSAGATPLPPEEVTPTWTFPSMGTFADAAT